MELLFMIMNLERDDYLLRNIYLVIHPSFYPCNMRMWQFYLC
jgi:hypothetical protein